jgi:hypothetical protein
MENIPKKNEALSKYLIDPFLENDPTIYLSADKYPYYLSKTKYLRKSFFFEEAQFRYEHTGIPNINKKLSLKEKIQKHREVRKNKSENVAK